MKEASFQDAVTIGQLLNVNKDEVWKIIKGVRFSSLDELGLAVHRAFKEQRATPSSLSVVDASRTDV